MFMGETNTAQIWHWKCPFLEKPLRHFDHQALQSSVSPMKCCKDAAVVTKFHHGIRKVQFEITLQQYQIYESRT